MAHQSNAGKAAERLRIGRDHHPLGGSSSSCDQEVVGAAGTARVAYRNQQLGLFHPVRQIGEAAGNIGRSDGRHRNQILK